MEQEEWRRWWKSRGGRDLRTLLMMRWDPIGVNGIPQAHDEYDGYLGPLAEKLRAGADTSDIAEYLAEIQTKRMGLAATTGQLFAVAEHITDWYRAEAPS